MVKLKTPVTKLFVSGVILFNRSTNMEFTNSVVYRSKEANHLIRVAFTFVTNYSENVSKNDINY